MKERNLQQTKYEQLELSFLINEVGYKASGSFAGSFVLPEEGVEFASILEWLFSEPFVSSFL